MDSKLLVNPVSAALLFIYSGEKKVSEKDKKEGQSRLWGHDQTIEYCSWRFMGSYK